MRLLDIVNGPWAVTPSMLTEIQSIYGRHLRGDKIDLAGIEASLGRPLDNGPQGYTVEDGVAILPIDGVIAKKMNLFSKISGGVSSELIGRDFMAALDDRGVEAIVLAMDSPGGTVDGTPELAELIYNARGTKPVLGYCDGMMASAMYWIGSAADSINISSEVVAVGSIGILAAHVDVSGAEAKSGIKTTEITAGKFKRIATKFGPLSQEGQADIQATVDYLYSAFVEDVAKQRGVTVDEVITRMADGRTFYGRQALEAGLVDGVATLAETIEQARALARSTTKPLGAGAASGQIKENNVNLKTLKADHPDLVLAITEEAQAGLAETIEQARATGASNEQARVVAVRAQLIPGHEALIERLAADGTTDGPGAAQAIIAAEQSARTAAAAALDTEAPAVVEGADGGDLGGEAQAMKRADFNKLPLDEQRAAVTSGVKITG